MSWKDKLKSTEFWLSILAIVVGCLVGSGLLGDGSIYSRVGGMIVEVLGVMGYTAARTLAKAGAGKAGWKTTEFWKSAAVAALVWAQAHVVPEGSQWATMLGSLLAVLPVGAYAVSRGVLKGAKEGSPTRQDDLLVPEFATDEKAASGR